MTRTGAVARPPIEDRTESFLEWTQDHLRELLIALAVLLVIAAGIWFYRSTRATKEEQGERALFEAERSYLSGNLPLAAKDLGNVSKNFDGTAAGVQAAMLYAQVQYEQQKYDDGIKALDKVAGEGAAKPFRASIHSLMAAGYEDQGKLREAAQHYEEAAKTTQFPNEQQIYRASAARAYGGAGDKATAAKLWKELAADPSSQVAGEARIRLGELEAAPDAA